MHRAVKAVEEARRAARATDAGAGGFLSGSVERARERLTTLGLHR